MKRDARTMKKRVRGVTAMPYHRALQRLIMQPAAMVRSNQGATRRNKRKRE
jgi:hypothetical protein